MYERVLKLLPLSLVAVMVVAMLGLWATQRQTDRAQWVAVAQTYRRVEYESRVAATRDEDMANQLAASADVVDLPESSDAWYLSVYVDEDWQSRPEQARLVSWFTTNPQLARLRDQTHDRLYTTDDPMYKARYNKSVTRVPAVVLQSPDGKVAYKVGSTEPVPETADEMVGQLQQIFQRWKCPCPHPFRKPEPDDEPPPPEPPVIPQIVPDIAPEEPPVEQTVEPVVEEAIPMGWFIFGGLAVMAVFAGVAVLYNIRRHPGP